MHRWLVAIVVIGCSSAEPVSTEADASLPSCSTTSCVAGASCRLPTGGKCECFDAGEWLCNTASAPPSDGGIAFPVDTAPPRDSALTAPPADSGGSKERSHKFDSIDCSMSTPKCTDASDVEVARSFIRNAMNSCGLSCTQLFFKTTTAGCPEAVVINNEWIEGGFSCVVGVLGGYRWPCATSFEVETSGCPD